MADVAPVSRRILNRPALLIFGMAILAAALLVLPGRTIVTRGLEDLFYIFDGVNRVLWGQVPGRDFITPLGPLAHYLPAFGQWVGGWGAALPVAVGLVLLVFAPVMAHVLTSRLHPVLALLMGGFLVLVLAAPMNLGEPMTALSFAQYHNRIGWVALALLLVLVLPPLDAGTAARDAAAAMILAFVMIYIRLTYGLAAMVFLVFMLCDRRQRAWAALALIGLTASVLVMELAWGGTAGYLRATGMAFGAGGLVRGSWGDIIDHVLVSFTDYVLLGLIAGISLWRRWSLRYAAFFALCALGGFWIINHNEQRWGILALHAAAVVAAERILREGDGPRMPIWGNAAGVRLFFLVMVLPTILHNGIALGLHASAALAGAGRPMPIARMEEVRLADLWTGGDFGGGNRYLGTVEDGIKALAELEPAPESLAVLGAADPFSVALDLRPAPGMMPFMRWLNTIGPGHHPDPGLVFAHADVVLVRRSGDPMPELYLPFLAREFTRVSETEFWQIYRRAPPEAGP
ncbi:hypothetical protein [Paracoccus benzoatiresistens]|uniref:Uncharacterized protein n=1 Tax=Paracoccus benzoatiresistens TaxID=2997341 RepID=A0ABT4J9I5_9RHOB|nr:hypothetical protein [Paracoccus sp. EF6]MCZ0963749.1 hypothetical protein [Paracoccus sp. EF6]